MTKNVTSVVLCILDGWGINPSQAYNGIKAAGTPCWSMMQEIYPMTQLLASGIYVGLPRGQMGNSEVGHMTIGSGRVVLQELPRIDMAIESGKILSLPAFNDFVANGLKGSRTIHIIGLLSPGGVHSHQDHLFYFAKTLAAQGFNIKVHAILDGRDTPPKSGYGFLKGFLKEIKAQHNITLATVGGRYFAMDRDRRWDRIEQAYQAIVKAEGSKSSDVLETVRECYEKDIGDEFIRPHVCGGYQGMQDGDSLMVVNFRADRVRQILTALLDPAFEEFERHEIPQFAAILGMSEYSQALAPLIPALFEKELITHTLGQVVSWAGLKQLRIAETEKYAHVTSFFNGGVELLFSGEDRKLIPSPKVATYDLKPEMAANEMTDMLVSCIKEKTYQLIVVNYANPDMVGHTGVQSAIIKAVETVDQCLARLLGVCKETDTVLVVTADHGNVEQMVDEETGEPHTAHTLNPVPFLVANAQENFSLKEGTLRDIAPTVLDIMGLLKPVDMTGSSLIETG